MARAEYRCTALVGTTKTGQLRADAAGYYEVVLGALDFYNSAGAFYAFSPAKSLFEESSSLMRRTANGALRGEYGHPKFLPGMTSQQFLMRVMDINEQSVSHHISEVYIDETSVRNKDGSSVIAIMGRVKPCGPFGDALAASFENPNENVCFSIRSLTEDIRDARGTLVKTLREIITWDYVNEPGISVANKYQAPGLEGFDLHSVAGGELHSRSFDIELLTQTRDYMMKSHMGMESSLARNIESAISAFKMSSQPSRSGLILPREAKW